MVNQLKKHLTWVSVLIPVLMLSACVTENYENDNTTPVVQNDSNRDDIAMTRITLGLGYLNMGNTTQAKLNLEKAKRFSPDLAQVHTAFAHYYETVGEADLATLSFEKALELSENDADTLNNYGVFLCRQGKYDEAEKQILKAISIPSYLLVSQSYENLALCQLKDNRFDKAELYLEKAILHNPSSSDVYLRMVQLKYAKGEYKNAKLFLKRYEKSTRRFSAEGLALAFKVFEKQRQMGTAKNYANMLVKMFPNSYEAKQYILNGLERIEADQMADDYKLANLTQQNGTSKKRVVILSPNKSGQSQTTLVARNKTKTAKAAQPVQAARTTQAANNTTTKASVQEPLPVESIIHQAELNNKELSKVGVSKVAVSKTDATKAKPVIVETAQASVAKPVNTIPSSNAENAAAFINQQLANVSAQPIVNKADKKAAPPAAIHLVAKGDSLFSISKKYNIKIKALKQWNNLTGSKVIRIGDTIYLDNPAKAQ